MVALAVRSRHAAGRGQEGLKFYLVPDFRAPCGANGVGDAGVRGDGTGVLHAVSLGIGAMAIFGSYIGKEQHACSARASTSTLLDTLCGADGGPYHFSRPAFPSASTRGRAQALYSSRCPISSVGMAGGRVWGALFFVFMSFAALSTVIAVFENIRCLRYGLVGLEPQKVGYRKPRAGVRT